MLKELIGSAEEYLASGGLVIVPLVGLGLALWFLVGLRVLALRRGLRGPLAAHLQEAPGQTARGEGEGIVEAALHGGREALALSRKEAQEQIDLVFVEQECRLVAYQRGIGIIVMVAPLLGLLGTVSGMIETFRSLVLMSLFTQSGGVAGGISEALVTTQMGLLVAIPGLLVGRMLDQKEQRIRHELLRLRKWLLMHSRYSGERAP